GLARLESGGRSCWTEDEMPGGGEPVHDAGAERQFGPDHREIDGLALGQRQQAVEIGRVDGTGSREPRDARVPGCAQELADISVARKPGYQRVLARTTADNENPPDVKDLGRERRLHPDRDYLVDLDKVCA